MSSSIEELDKKVERVRAAQAIFARYDQKQVDEIFQQAAAVATSQRLVLASCVFYTSPSQRA